MLTPEYIAAIERHSDLLEKLIGRKPVKRLKIKTEAQQIQQESDEIYQNMLNGIAKKTLKE